jgi:hypothetical protein
VLNFYVNDAEEVASATQPSLLLRHCYACVFVAGRVDGLMREFLGRPDWSTYYLGLYDDGATKGWLDAKNAIGKLADFARASGVTFMIANLPELHDVGRYRLQHITDLVRATAEQHGVAFVDLLPYLKDQQASKLWVTAPDPHPNAFAHELIAQGIFDALRKLDAKP